MDYAAAIKDGVVVVTGASGGLGRALTQTLLGQGVKVAGLARSADQLNEIATTAPAGQFLPVPVDVADAAAVAVVFDAVRGFGTPTALINNAAVYPHRDILDETPDSFMQTVQINLGGMVACTHEVLKDMTEQGFGRIVNVTTYAGNAPAPVSSAYSVSKGATRIFNAALLADLGDRFPDIVITEWIPGALNTAMGIPAGIDPDLAAGWGARLALWHDRALSGVSFAQDRSVPPPQGWKRRLVNRVSGQGPRTFVLG